MFRFWDAVLAGRDKAIATLDHVLRVLCSEGLGAIAFHVSAYNIVERPPNRANGIDGLTTKLRTNKDYGFRYCTQ